MRRWWPGFLECTDVEKFDDGGWKQIKDRCVGVIDTVLIGGGSPCQDLSVLNTGRKHLKGDRSKLFWHFPRLVKEAKVYFPDVEINFMLENVMSMTPTSRRMISAALSSRPWLLDGRWFTHCRRPRLFWTSWPLQPHECFYIISH